LAKEQSVTIAIYDLLGRRVTTLVDGPRERGVHQIEWTPGQGQSSLSSGVYICRMQAGTYTASRKLVLVR
jgi:flagellar hook assembly protein FlgD